jgi:hypothetical protein
MDTTESVVADLNVALGTDYRLVRRLTGGLQSGAFELTDGVVLKWTGNPDWAPRVHRAADLVRRARAAGYPTPEWLAVGTTTRQPAAQPPAWTQPPTPATPPQPSVSRLAHTTDGRSGEHPRLRSPAASAGPSPWACGRRHGCLALAAPAVGSGSKPRQPVAEVGWLGQPTSDRVRWLALATCSSRHSRRLRGLGLRQRRRVRPQPITRHGATGSHRRAPSARPPGRVARTSGASIVRRC